MEVYKDSGFLVVVPPPRFLWKLIFTCFFLFSKQKTNQKVLYLINFYIEILYYYNIIIYLKLNIIIYFYNLFKIKNHTYSELIVLKSCIYNQTMY